jgi:hypothetical protein
MEEKKADSISDLRVPSSVQFFKCDRGMHPTQKPTELFEYLIKTYTNEGDLVFDGFAGSGTTYTANITPAGAGEVTVSVAANVAEDAWPLGKLDVLGVRTSKRSSPDVVGRSRRKSRLMPWLTIKLSMPSATDRASACWNRSLDPMERSKPTTCQTMLKSPIVLAKPKSATVALLLRSGSRMRSAAESNDVIRDLQWCFRQGMQSVQDVQVAQSGPSRRIEHK